MKWAVACLVFSLAIPATAHESWINRSRAKSAAGELCCGDNDCFVVPAEHVWAAPDGYHVALRLAADGQTYAIEVVPFSDAQPAPDGQYWRCRKPTGERRCFFAPMPSY